VLQKLTGAITIITCLPSERAQLVATEIHRNSVGVANNGKGCAFALNGGDTEMKNVTP